MTQINRKLHLALGRCWHETERRYVAGDIKSVCKKCNAYGFPILQGNPDYCNDPRLVIEAMMERDYWPEFLGQVGYITVENGYGTTIWKEYVRVDLIMDTSGKLALLAIEWLGQQEGGKDAEI